MLVVLLTLLGLAAGTPAVQSAAASEDAALAGGPQVHRSPRDGSLQSADLSGDLCSPCACRGRVVDCRSRGLKTFLEVPQVANASTLDLRDNDLREIPSEAFTDFSELDQLLLSENAISTINVLAFAGLGRLRLLDLQGNRLDVAAALTPELLAPLQRLRVLKLNNNTALQPSLYPDQAFAVLNSSLQELHLDAVGELEFRSGFSQLQRLEKVCLSGSAGYCEISYLSSRAFQNVAKVKELDLTNCGIVHIAEGTFAPLRELRILDLSDNLRLGFKNLTIATIGLLYTSIRVLKVNAIYPQTATCVSIRKCHLIHLARTHLEEIHLDENNIQTIEEGALRMLPKSLKRISARYNDFTVGYYLYDIHFLQNLTFLDLTMQGRKRMFPLRLTTEIRCAYECPFENQASKVIEWRYGEESTEVQSGPRVDFHHGDITFSLPVPPNLKQLILQWCQLFYDLSKVDVSNNSIEVLDLSYNLFSEWMGPIHGLNQLTHLNLTFNLANSLHKEFFKYFPRLEHLNISHNNLAGIMAGTPINRTFENLKSLKVLDVSYNWISKVHKEALFGLDSLEELYMSNNKMVYQQLDLHLLPLKKLKIVDLSQNELTSLPRQVSQVLDQIGSRRSVPLWLDLSMNPIACTCQNMKFLLWINSTKVHLLNGDRLSCTFDNGTVGSIWDGLEVLQVRCDIHWALALGCAVALVVATVSTLGFVAYRYRWKLRYLYYGAWATHRRVCKREFRYHAFVSYDSEDASFVENEFRSRLEARDLKLCIHGLHFTPGRPIICNIFEAIQTSRRTVCILSQNFLESYWCQYEMQMAMQEGVQTGRDVVLLVILDPRCKYGRSLPREVLHYIQTDSYIEYPTERKYADIFWDNLTRALKDK